MAGSMKLFVVWGAERRVCIVSAQTAEHALKLAVVSRGSYRPSTDSVQEIKATEFAPGVVWMGSTS